MAAQTLVKDILNKSFVKTVKCLLIPMTIGDDSVAALMRLSWQRIGFQVTLEVTPWESYSSSLTDKRYHRDSVYRIDDIKATIPYECIMGVKCVQPKDADAPPMPHTEDHIYMQCKYIFKGVLQSAPPEVPVFRCMTTYGGGNDAYLLIDKDGDIVINTIGSCFGRNSTTLRLVYLTK